jgi:tRNA nucleotidyltransferase (CCA-adding enzyme)
MPPRPAQDVGPGAEVEAEVARRLAPSAELLERLARAREELVAKVTDAARQRGSPLVRALVAGSAARGTFLGDRLDIDLFMLFPPDLADDRLREEGLALGRAVLSDPAVRYAEHPYLRGTFDGWPVDAVPGFAITDPAHPRSPVDRTPFHQAYLSERETPEIVAQVRLAKQFLRTLGVYGAEAKTEGFSGYLVELLLLRYGSLRELLRTARGWTVPVRLDPPERDPPRLPGEVALILADPVDPNRNVASALSRRNLGIVIVSARAYLERPSAAWFEAREAPKFTKAAALRQVGERGSAVVVVALARPDLVDDTLFPQLRKAERAVVDELARAGFHVLGSSSAADEKGLVLVVELAHRDRPLVRLHGGPPPGLDRAGDFLAAWPAGRSDVLQGPYVRADGSLGVEARQGEVAAVGFLRERLARLSLGKNLTAGPGSSVVDLKDAGPSEALEEALRSLLAKALPWPPQPPSA